MKAPLAILLFALVPLITACGGLLGAQSYRFQIDLTCDCRFSGTATIFAGGQSISRDVSGGSGSVSFDGTGERIQVRAQKSTVLGTLTVRIIVNGRIVSNSTTVPFGTVELNAP